MRLVRPSVRPSLPHRLVTQKQENVDRSKFVYKFLRTRVSGVPIFSVEKSKVKGEGYRMSKKHRKLASCLLTGGGLRTLYSHCKLVLNVLVLFFSVRL